MNAYRCWHYLCRETETVVIAVSSFSARREIASILGVSVTDIMAVAMQYEGNDHEIRCNSTLHT